MTFRQSTRVSCRLRITHQPSPYREISVPAPVNPARTGMHRYRYPALFIPFCQQRRYPTGRYRDRDPCRDRYEGVSLDTTRGEVDKVSGNRAPQQRAVSNERQLYVKLKVSSTPRDNALGCIVQL